MNAYSNEPNSRWNEKTWLATTLKLLFTISFIIPLVTLAYADHLPPASEYVQLFVIKLWPIAKSHIEALKLVGGLYINIYVYNFLLALSLTLSSFTLLTLNVAWKPIDYLRMYCSTFNSIPIWSYGVLIAIIIFMIFLDGPSTRARWFAFNVERPGFIPFRMWLSYMFVFSVIMTAIHMIIINVIAEIRITRHGR
jgi:hypothetical protein